MSTVNGIGVDAWAIIDADCANSYEIVGEHVQLRLGSPRGNGLTVVFSEESIKKHITTCSEALRKMSDGHAAH